MRHPAELLHDLRGAGEQDAVSVLDKCATDSRSRMALAGPGGPNNSRLVALSSQVSRRSSRVARRPRTLIPRGINTLGGNSPKRSVPAVAIFVAIAVAALARSRWRYLFADGWRDARRCVSGGSYGSWGK